MVCPGFKILTDFTVKNKFLIFTGDRNKIVFKKIVIFINDLIKFFFRNTGITKRLSKIFPRFLTCIHFIMTGYIEVFFFPKIHTVLYRFVFTVKFNVCFIFN